MAEQRKSEQFLDKAGLQQYDSLIKKNTDDKIAAAIKDAKVPTLSVDKNTNTLIIG